MLKALSRAWVVPVLLALAVAGCGGDDDNDDGGGASSPAPDATPTVDPTLAAQRPAWFPREFPLYARTQVVREEETDTGGRAQFRMPIPYTQAITVLDGNLERNGFTVLERTIGDDTATYRIENNDVTGEVVVTPSDPDVLVEVEITRK